MWVAFFLNHTGCRYIGLLLFMFECFRSTSKPLSMSRVFFDPIWTRLFQLEGIGGIPSSPVNLIPIESRGEGFQTNLQIDRRIWRQP